MIDLFAKTIIPGQQGTYRHLTTRVSRYSRIRVRTARDHAEAALVVHESVPSASKSPSREAIARLDLATAIAQLGSPDEAVVLGSQALTSTRVVTSVLLRAGDLTKVLVNRYPKLACVREFHEHYWHIAERVAKEYGS
jgi:hypothetical protein